MAASRRIFHVVLVHGADALPFAEDIAEAERRGAVAHPLALPPFRGHPIDDCRAYYDAVSDLIGTTIEGIRGTGGDVRIAAIGRNLGGSLLAYHAAGSGDLDALAIIGAIPDLARFRAESDHPGAQAYRAKLPAPEDVRRIAATASLDLAVSLQGVRPERCLLQVGTADPWIDDVSRAAYRDFEAAMFRVEWLADGHAMVSSAALARRWAFLGKVARQ